MTNNADAPVVLMVDDDPDIIAAGELKFEGVYGYDFRSASTYEEALKVIQATSEEMVIYTDINLEGKTPNETLPLGLKLIRWCHLNVSHRVVVYGFTSDRRSYVLMTALKSGAITVFYKDSDDNILDVMEVLVCHAEVSVVKSALRAKWVDSSTGFWNIEGFRMQVLPQLEVARLREGHEDGLERRDEKHFSQFSLLFIELVIEELNESEDFDLVDQLIVKFVTIVKANVWPTDHLCRFGEFKFLVFLPDAPEARANGISEAILKQSKGQKVGSCKAVPILKMGISHMSRDELGKDPALDLEHLITKARKARC